MSVILKCNGCHRKMRAPATLTGKRVRCKCGERLAVPMPEGGAGSLPGWNSVEAADPEPLADLGLLAGGEDISSGRVCSGCLAPMPDDAVLCTACGFDTRTGRKVKAAEDRIADGREAKPAAPEAAGVKKPARVNDDSSGKLGLVASLVKPLIILTIVAGVIGTGWYLKSAVFFDPQKQMNDDHAKIANGMTVQEVVDVLGKKPRTIETLRTDGSGGFNPKLITRKLEYKDDFMNHYSKKDLRFGFTFKYRYSERAELHIHFAENGKVLSAEVNDPLQSLNL